MDIASKNSDPYALPRLVDTTGISDDEFSAWLNGLASFVPRRAHRPDPGQLVDPEEESVQFTAAVY
jgi:hypothetical protein